MTNDHDVENFARAVGPLAPRPEVRARLLESIDGTPQEARVPARPPWALAATAAAVVLGATLWLATERRSDEPGKFTVAAPGHSAARAPWEEPPEVAKERAENEAVYEREKERLHRDLKGKMILIAQGKVVEVTGNGPQPKPGDRGSTTQHAFLFRVGDDGPRGEFISEWYAPRFAGLALPKALGVEWSMQEKTLRVKGGNREQKGIGSVFPRYLFDLEGPPREPGVPGPRLTSREVFIGTVGPPLMLAPEDAVALNLARWEIPGLVTIWNHVRCRQATVVVSVAGWDAPQTITALWPLTPRENLILWARIRDTFWGGPFVDVIMAAAGNPDGSLPWILFERDRVSTRSKNPSSLLEGIDRDTEATYHRYVMRWPREPDLVLEESAFVEAKEDVLLNDVPHRPRVHGTEGPYLVTPAEAAALHLERVEEGRGMLLKGTDGRFTTLMGGYVWTTTSPPLVGRGSGSPPIVSSRKAVLVVYPFVPPPPPPPSVIPDPMRPK